MDKSVEICGNVCLDGYIMQRVTKDSPINLQYYKIYDEILQEEKPYGIGISKTQKYDGETIIEKNEFNNIFSEEKDANDMLNILIENKVTPMCLRDILEDFVVI